MTALAGINPILPGFLESGSAPVYHSRTHMAVNRGRFLRIVFTAFHMAECTGGSFVVFRLHGFAPIPRMLLRFINHTMIRLPVHLVLIMDYPCMSNTAIVGFSRLCQRKIMSRMTSIATVLGNCVACGAGGYLRLRLCYLPRSFNRTYMKCVGMRSNLATAVSCLLFRMTLTTMLP